MQKLSFELVLDQKKSKYDIGVSEKFSWIGIGGVGIILLFIKIFESSFNINLEEIDLVNYLFLGFLICIGIGTFYGFFEYNGKNRIIRGFITFSEDEITINHARKHELSKIEKLRFSVLDHKGRLINLLSDGDPTRSYGGDNFVEFTYQNKDYKYQFVVDSIAHRKLLMEKTISKMKTKTEIKY